MVNGTILVGCEYSIIVDLSARTWSGGDRCTIPEYNCIAWSVGQTNKWYNQIHMDACSSSPNGVFDYPGDVDAFYFSQAGLVPDTDPSTTDQQKAKTAKAMYYSGYHGAKRKNCGCGAGKWIMYESKCGEWERIEHRWDQLNGAYGYGTPIRFYK